MTKPLTRLTVTVCALGAAVIAWTALTPEVAEAQWGERDQRQERRQTQDKQAQDGPPTEADAQKLWTWLERAEYKQWAPYPETDTGFVPGGSPHGKHLKLFVNRAVFEDPDNPPHGAVVVKENYTPDKKLAAITIMQRVKGYDAENDDWFWVKYQADGSVAKRGDKPIAGKVTSCIACHRNAAGDDYLFTNDE